MKKVLIGLLVLAVAGGGVFAQEWQFNGEIRTGLGMFFFQDDDDPVVGLVTDDPDEGMRADLRARVANADGTAGLDILFRADGGHAPEVRTPHAFGWLNFMDNMLTLQGGRIDDAAGFNSFDRMAGTRMGEGTGLRLLVRPMDGLVLNLGVYGRADGWLGFENDDSPAATSENMGQVRAVFAVRYEEPGLFRLVAGARTANEAHGPAGGFDGWLAVPAAAPNPAIPSRRAQSTSPNNHASAAYFSFEYLGLGGDGIHIAASAFFMNLEEFGDYGFMFYYASFGHTGLVDGMDLRAGVGLGLAQHDLLDDMYLWIWGSVDYQLSDRVVPRLDLHYVMGGRSNRQVQTMHHRNVARGGATFNSDDSFLRIQPSVQFRVQTNTFVELGAVFNVCLGEDENPTWTRTPVNADRHGVNAAVYALMRVSF
ncbi:MAG: hypothetical protein FWB99_02575 [Treponema sp.]|nr:hypothetical protein [Treponema sp.]